MSNIYLYKRERIKRKNINLFVNYQSNDFLFSPNLLKSMKNIRRWAIDKQSKWNNTETWCIPLSIAASDRFLSDVDCGFEINNWTLDVNDIAPKLFEKCHKCKQRRQLSHILSIHQTLKSFDKLVAAFFESQLGSVSRESRIVHDYAPLRFLAMNKSQSIEWCNCPSLSLFFSPNFYCLSTFSTQHVRLNLLHFAKFVSTQNSNN